MSTIARSRSAEPITRTFRGSSLGGSTPRASGVSRSAAIRSAASGRQRATSSVVSASVARVSAVVSSRSASASVPTCPTRAVRHGATGCTSQVTRCPAS
jgi:hypothetical protein